MLLSARRSLDELLPRVPGLTAADVQLNRPFGSPTQRDRGVCDYTKPGVGQRPPDGTWQMF
jgi:hypothetical protein